MNSSAPFLIFTDEETTQDVVVETAAQVHHTEENFNLVIGDSENVTNQELNMRENKDLDAIQVVEPRNQDSTEEIMNLFGVDPLNNTKQGVALLGGIASRWDHNIKNGLGNEEIQILVDKYPPPNNCCALVPPLLNEEIAGSLKENKIREDKYLQKLQTQIAAGLMAIYDPIKTMVSENSDNTRSLENLADAGKIFTDIFHQISRHRRFLLNAFLNPKYKKLLENQPIDKFLYGENLMDKVKQSQAAQSASSQVGAIIKQRNPVQHFLNYKGPLNSKPNLRTYRGAERSQWNASRGTNRPPRRTEIPNNTFKKSYQWKAKRNQR